MAKQTIKLPRGEWKFDDKKLVGRPGGFGDVFLGTGDEGKIAIKRLKITASEAAHRELRIAKALMQRNLTHIVPFLDAGQDAQSDRYFLVMPLCEKSLQDEIDTRGDGFPQDDVTRIILSILKGLDEVSDIVHRDLKPSNVLKHGNAWKIADFGIAKFIEDSTSLQTLRRNLTPAYAAPEQWEGLTPTHATDIYATGCIVYALAEGRPPFDGDVDALQEKHRHAAPELLASLSPRLSAFVAQMLRKSPEARPTLKRCLEVFTKDPLELKVAGKAHHSLSEAAKQVAIKNAEREAELRTKERQRLARAALVTDATISLKKITSNLVHEFKQASENVSVSSSGSLNFGDADVQLPYTVHSVDPVASGHDIVCWSSISVMCVPRRYTWSASLLFMNYDGDGEYRWYEVAFWAMRSNRSHPFSLPGHSHEIALALGRGLHTVSPAYGPLAIDGEEEELFRDRWLRLVSRAATNNLMEPSYMPIRNLDQVLG